MATSKLRLALASQGLRRRSCCCTCSSLACRIGGGGSSCVLCLCVSGAGLVGERDVSTAALAAEACVRDGDIEVAVSSSVLEAAADGVAVASARLSPAALAAEARLVHCVGECASVDLEKIQTVSVMAECSCGRLRSPTSDISA